MAHVGQGTTHKGQIDELDAEIAAMEAEVQGKTQQPEATPEQVAQQQQPPPAPEQGEQQYEEVITSRKNFALLSSKATVFSLSCSTTNRRIVRNVLPSSED